jgi:hypothetical protein
LYFYPLNSEANQKFTCAYYEDYHRRFCNTPMKYTKAYIDISNKFRMLWEQHGFWTRSAVMSLALDLPDVDFVVRRLLQNPKDFAQALKPFYGDKIAAKFSDLLTSHLTIAAQLVKAAKAGDNAAASEVEKQWYANADEIAAFLGSINPYWSQEDWRIMLHNHLELVKAEAVHAINKDFEAGIRVFDEIERQALGMADVMSMGISNQFSIF